MKVNLISKNTLAKFQDKTHQKIVLLETMALAMAGNITILEALHKGATRSARDDNYRV